MGRVYEKMLNAKKFRIIFLKIFLFSYLFDIFPFFVNEEKMCNAAKTSSYIKTYTHSIICCTILISGRWEIRKYLLLRSMV